MGKVIEYNLPAILYVMAIEKHSATSSYMYLIWQRNNLRDINIYTEMFHYILQTTIKIISTGHYRKDTNN